MVQCLYRVDIQGVVPDTLKFSTIKQHNIKVLCSVSRSKTSGNTLASFQVFDIAVKYQRPFSFSRSLYKMMVQNGRILPCQEERYLLFSSLYSNTKSEAVWEKRIYQDVEGQPEKYSGKAFKRVKNSF